MNLTIKKDEILENGFSIINNIYSHPEIEQIKSIIHQADSSKDTFRKSNDLFAVRQFLKGIPETIDWTKETETICKVNKGGIMIMKPLLLHSSNKTTNNSKRRVIHIEFSNMELPQELNLSERI